MARSIELDLQERLKVASGPSEEQIRESYRRAGRAARLLQNEDFMAWREIILQGKERLVRRLVGRTESAQDADIIRGKIVAIEQLFTELEIQAGNLEEASRRLETYEHERAEPVHQRWGLRGYSGR